MAKSRYRNKISRDGLNYYCTFPSCSLCWDGIWSVKVFWEIMPLKWKRRKQEWKEGAGRPWYRWTNPTSGIGSPLKKSCIEWKWLDLETIICSVIGWKHRTTPKSSRQTHSCQKLETTSQLYALPFDNFFLKGGSEQHISSSLPDQSFHNSVKELRVNERR